MISLKQLEENILEKVPARKYCFELNKDGLMGRDLVVVK